MPKDFTDCVKNKSRVRTIKPTGSRYIRICYDNKGVHMDKYITIKLM